MHAYAQKFPMDVLTLLVSAAHMSVNSEANSAPSDCDGTAPLPAAALCASVPALAASSPTPFLGPSVAPAPMDLQPPLKVMVSNHLEEGC